MGAPKLAQWLRFEEGQAIARTGKAELGQGLHGALAQIVAEELDLAPARVRIEGPDSEAAPDEGYHVRTSARRRSTSARKKLFMLTAR